VGSTVQESPQLVAPDRRAGRPHPAREQPKEDSQAIVVEHRRCLDDLGGDSALSGLEHARERFGELIGQCAHRVETIDACNRS